LENQSLEQPPTASTPQVLLAGLEESSPKEVMAGAEKPFLKKLRKNLLFLSQI